MQAKCKKLPNPRSESLSVKKMLLSGRFTTTEIANFADVTDYFVEKVKKTLN